MREREREKERRSERERERERERGRKNQYILNAFTKKLALTPSESNVLIKINLPDFSLAFYT